MIKNKIDCVLVFNISQNPNSTTMAWILIIGIVQRVNKTIWLRKKKQPHKNGRTKVVVEKGWRKKKFVDYNIEICKVAHFSSYVSVSVKPVYGLLFPWGKRCAAQRNATQARLLSSTTTCSSGGESNFGWRSIWWYLIAKKELWSRKRHSAVRSFLQVWASTTSLTFLAVC